eukprot:517977-Amphidinium_carterae.1
MLVSAISLKSGLNFQILDDDHVDYVDDCDGGDYKSSSPSPCCYSVSIPPQMKHFAPIRCSFGGAAYERPRPSDYMHLY